MQLGGLEHEVYSGGVCEVSFAFTPKGDLVAIGRNEDGDHTGFGSQLFFAPKERYVERGGPMRGAPDRRKAEPPRSAIEFTDGVRAKTARRTVAGFGPPSGPDLLIAEETRELRLPSSLSLGLSVFQETGVRRAANE